MEFISNYKFETIYESKRTEISLRIGRNEKGEIVEKKIYKHTSNPLEFNLVADNNLSHIIFEYVSNYGYFDDTEFDDGSVEYALSKEYIEESPEIQEKIVSLCNWWDIISETAYPLYDYTENYLKSDTLAPFREQHVYNHFIKHVKSNEREFFEHYVNLVEELKLYKIYNIDWHTNNFGMKNGHLALFELGGAKIKEVNK